jgi:hypothetical protein
MLTIEWSKEDERLEIHGDEEGLSHLAQLVQSLANQKEPEHVHLMSEAWGGDTLGNEKQNENNELINHVKIFKW